MPRPVLLALLALVLALAPAAAHAAPAPGLNIAFGPGVEAAYVDSQLDLVRRAHFTQVRVEIAWSALEPDAQGLQDAGYVATVDRLMDAAARRHLKVIAVLQGSPCWATSAPDDRKGSCAADKEDVWSTFPPKEAADYGAVAGYVARRWEATLAALEVWNEPDHASEAYFGGPDKPARYAEILKAAYASVDRMAPAVPVLAGSLVGADGVFLKALYAEGIKGYYDGLAVHYYDLVLASLRSIRAVQREAGDAKPLWLTEFGWTTCFPRRTTQSGHACVGRGAQADNLVNIYRALRATSWVRSAAIYTIQDSRQYDFGLLDVKAGRKPALRALTSAFGGRLGRVDPIALRLERSGGRVVARGSAPAGDALELDAYRKGRLAYKATFRLDRANRFSLRLPSQLGTSGIRVRVYQYWSGVSATKRI